MRSSPLILREECRCLFQDLVLLLQFLHFFLQSQNFLIYRRIATSRGLCSIKKFRKFEFIFNKIVEKADRVIDRKPAAGNTWN